MQRLGADDAIRKNVGALEALSLPKGKRPNPKKYISEIDYKNHLDKFNDGGSRIVTRKDFDDYGIGKPDNGNTEFISTKSDIDKIINLPIEQQAKKLGISVEQLKEGGGLVRIDFNHSDKIQIPSGNEWGVNKNWIPGGKTSGGVDEAIVKTKGMVEGIDYIVTKGL
jgi:hypothetical protein